MRTGEIAVGAGAEGITSATDFINHAGHGLSDGDRIWYDANGGTAITGLTDGAYYFVVNADSNKFKLSATNGGAAINITAATGTAVATNHRYVKAAVNTSVGGLDPKPPLLCSICGWG